MSAPEGGRILTFYSYKGGTGRSMALANVAWILASQGRRVLTIDWDLEAPGLHRYFHPFIEDKELTESPGLIDFLTEFSEAARHAKRDVEEGAARAEPTATTWHEPYLSLLRFTYSLDWDFGDGTLDLVPAGRQGPGYAVRVNEFDWHSFYDQLGGGVLLEGLKRRLREDYDYILIDSRTGISDTSGVCTVQMPDDLVVCFTLNLQSVKGASAVVESVDLQRRRPTGAPSLRVWPVATRIELGEKERLDATRQFARAAFQGYLRHLRRTERAVYWSATEVLYQPYFAYQEVLAVFAEERRGKASILSSLENLASYITDGDVRELAEMSESDRMRGLGLFKPLSIGGEPARAITSQEQSGRIFISFPREDVAECKRLAEALVERMGTQIWWEGNEVLPGDDWGVVIRRAFDAATIVLACFGPGWLKRPFPRIFENQVGAAFDRGTRVVPVLVGGLSIEQWSEALDRDPFQRLEKLRDLFAVSITPSDFALDVQKLTGNLSRLLARSAPSPATIRALVADDPQKGQWGGSASSRSRQLSAKVTPLSPDWFEVELAVVRTGGPALEDPVEFHLPPRLRPSIQKIQPRDDQATYTVMSSGAFTVGVSADGGRTRLELDLSADPSFPEDFRER